MGVGDHVMSTPDSDRPYPVVNADPSLGAILRNVAFGDYFLTVGWTLIGATWGFAAGAHATPTLP